MMLGRVTGTVVAPIKNSHLEKNKLLLVQPLDLNMNPKGEELVALDVVQAGEGDLVLLMKEGGSARIIFNDPKIPLQSVVVAVVDGFSLDIPPDEAHQE
ncbi:MAG: hypothetical protein D6785_09550 [Planctomycetota bacterium]|nr:MAG: hypothetical protein D6785_09550 [Planctomycetota bacterium]